MAAKLDIKRELQAVNSKNYDFYDGLSAEEKKAFSPYILMRYVSNPQNQDAQEWCIEPLLWKLYAGMGLGMNLNYQYLAAGKKEKVDKIEKLLAELNPAMKISDVKLLASLMSDEDKKELFDKMGFDKKQRKEYE
jgi:hypothetical protein